MEITLKEPSLFYLRLEQEASQLLELCRQAGIPCKDLMDKPAKRQREWAAERLLLCQAFGQPVKLVHTEQGAPMVDGSDVNVSISHTSRLVVLACDDLNVIGVDAEQADRVQVLRVRDKFLNAAEQEFIAPDDLAAHIIAWTAKEAVIKATRDSAVDWTNGICLEPFAIHPVKTTLVARCGAKCYRLTSQLIDDHYITVAAPM